MKLGLIWAQGRNGVIGNRGQLPWHLPEDLAHFKRVTQGHPVIMGRTTWESLPPRFRPLPGRANIVVSSQQGEALHAIERMGATVVSSVSGAIAHCQHDHANTPIAWVIGGAQIYAAAINLADTLMVTHIDHDFAGDAFAPQIDALQWHILDVTEHTSTSGLGLRFVTYGRQNRKVDNCRI